MAAVATAPHSMLLLESFTPDDFETASIRSAAPSYISDAPSYSTIPNEPVPPYSPPSAPSYAPGSGSSAGSSSISGAASSYTSARHNSAPTLLPSATASSSSSRGLPPIPPAAPRRRSDVPNLGQFRIPTWSTINSNPTARHYHRVANRRVQAQAANSHLEGLKRIVLDRVEEEERNATRLRPLEDPYLVGEEAAERARNERLARENGDEILIREDRRWDWFLAQMKDWDERERSWKQFRREIETGSRGKLARRIGAGFR
ncbi:hypothetical protein NKR23_g1995 [Pleurostoma richardsiae]|uniref:Uncharacterized protein n=1 Tax=Pleurostoma richardsiae TaxID=41990 RepID=A0AA38RRM1_9PEZI|nr:hypothetical protein NKR23_g1995 [Pleurostoma richardsiae]